MTPKTPNRLYPRATSTFSSLNRDPRIALSMVDLKQLLPLPEVRGVLDRVKQDPDLESINSMAKKYLGVDEYPYHQPGDERVVVYVKPQHATYIG